MALFAGLLLASSSVGVADPQSAAGSAVPTVDATTGPAADRTFLRAAVQALAVFLVALLIAAHVGLSVQLLALRRDRAPALPLRGATSGRASRHPASTAPAPPHPAPRPPWTGTRPRRLPATAVLPLLSGSVPRPCRGSLRVTPAPVRQTGRARTAASVLLLLVGAGLGLAAMRADVRPPTDTGLLTVLPASFWAAVAVLLSGFTLATWCRRMSQWLAAGHLTVLVILLYGIGVAGTPYPRGTVPWRHVGVAAELVTTRLVDPGIDAYFGWPGFFALLATYTGLSGLEDGQALMRWAPVVNELLLMLPLLVVLRALTPNPRLVWSAVAFFYVTHWVDQDYLAPQAMSFFLYLCVLGLLLTFFLPGAPPVLRGRRPVPRLLDGALRLVRGAGPSHRPLPPAAAGPGSRVWVLGLVVMIIVAIISMHQLTPYAVWLALVALALARRTALRSLPLVTGVLIVTWLTYSAASYLQGNLGELLAGVGDLAGAAQGGLVDRIQGSPGHLLVVRGRLLFSLAVWGLAGLAVLLLYLRGRRDTTPALLLATPGPLFAMQSYGGEMLLRIFMFSLPFACFLAVQLLPSARTDRGRRLAGALFLGTALVTAPAFVLVHYGNQRIDVRSELEVQAVRELYRVAPPEALLVAGNDNTPWRYTQYGLHRHVTLERVLKKNAPTDAAAVEQALHAEFVRQPAGALLLITQQQHDYEDLFGRRTPYSLAEVERRLSESPSFEVVLRNAHAVVLRAVAEGAG